MEGTLNLIEVIAFLPDGTQLHVPSEQITQWNPALPGLSYRSPGDGRIHSLLGCTFEIIFEEGRIARIA